MPGQKPKTARAIAVDVLRQFDPKRNYASPILNTLLARTQEKRRATDLVFGCVRNRPAIDTVIAKFADCPAQRIPARLINIIRVAVYELIYSPATPEYSIVNEAVENAKAVGGRKQTGFVNAVLRQINRHITNRNILLKEANAGKTLPQAPETGCEFDSSFLPEPTTSQSDYLSAAFSLPQWLITDWLGKFGPEQTRQICFASNRSPSIYLRPNSLKTTTQQLVEKLRQGDVDVETTTDKTMIKIKAARAVTELVGFEEGLFVVQDVTASQAVRILAPQTGWKILDLCAAPGVKTTQLAETAADSAIIIATDIDSERLRKVKENTARLGINSVKIVTYEDIEMQAAKIGPFDAVLLDVPCSNTGVLAKRIEARYRVNPNTIGKLAKIQSELLATSATLVKPQGKICYSTCSIQSCENSELVKDFLLRYRSFELESEKLILPSAEDFDYDGGYIAIITRHH